MSPGAGGVFDSFAGQPRLAKASQNGSPTSSRRHATQFRKSPGYAVRRYFETPSDESVFGIPAQWQDFQPSIGNIEGAAGRAAFGMISNDGLDCEDFEYIVAVEVSLDADIPAKLVSITVPALQWARFRHVGDVTSLRATIGAASDRAPRTA